MIGRLGLLAVVAIAGIALGGCAQQTSPEQRNAAATPEATGSRTPSAAEPTAERTAGGGDRGGTWGSIRGLVTRVSHQPNGSHWITVEKDPGADCGTRARRRGDPCEKWGLQILDDTVVLRGQGGDARPASPSDVEESQMVRAFPGDITEFESYPPTAGADKVVILGPGVSGTEGAGTPGRAGASGGPEVLLARQAPDPDGFATALISGELVLEGRGCLRIARQRGPSPVPVWPSGYEARVEGDEVRVVNGRGRTVARVGEGIRAGGGEAESLNELGAVEREEAREIQERCPSGKYWLVGGGVKTTPRG